MNEKILLVLCRPNTQTVESLRTDLNQLIFGTNDLVTVRERNQQLVTSHDQRAE